MKKTFLFYFLLILTIFSFGLGMIGSLLTKDSANLFPPSYNVMNVVVDLQTNREDDVILKVNDKFYSIPFSKNVLNKAIQEKVKTLDILVKEGVEKKIKGIIVFNDLKTNYFHDLSNFKQLETTNLCPVNVCSNYTKYQFPSSIKFNKNSEFINYHSNLNTISSLLIQAFGSGYNFLFSYILLFLTIIYFINNKEQIKRYKLPLTFYTVLILVFGTILYLNGALEYLPWVDEYRTIEYSDPSSPFIKTFSDPGNPPLFYILFRFFLYFFHVSNFSMKLFPLIIGFSFIFTLYFILKKMYGQKCANVGILLAFLNVPLICFTKETRCYILQVLFTPLIVYTLFKIFETNKTKYYSIYAILAILASNTHYYEILFLISNFIFATFYFINKKRYKDILKFFIANVTGAVFFLPFFLYTSLNGALMDSSFNAWIPKTDFSQIKKCVFYLFGGGVAFFISALFAIKVYFSNSKRKLLILYSYITIISVILFGIILSVLIRPMLVERYLFLLAPLYIIFLALIFTDEYKNKYTVILFLVFIIFMQGGFFEKNNRRKGLLDLPLSMSMQYFDYKKEDETINVIISFSNRPDYLESKNKLVRPEIKYYSLSVFDTKKCIDKILKEEKSPVIFTSNILPLEDKFEIPKDYKCYFNSSSDMCLWRIEKENKQ